MHTSTTTGRPGRYRRRSPHLGRTGSAVGSVLYTGDAAGVGGGRSTGGCGGVGRGGWAMAGVVVATAALGAAAASAALGAAAASAPAGAAAADASPAATAAKFPAADAAQGWVALLWRKGAGGEEPGCHGG